MENQNTDTLTSENSKTFKKVKPLLYILPNDQSSLQESVSSAITTAVNLEQDSSGSSNLALDILKVSSLITLELVFPLGLRVGEKILEFQATQKQSDSDIVSNSDNQEKNNINEILNSLNLEQWTDFVEEITYSDITDNFDFPPGHPLPGKLYRIHPLKSKSNKYIPIEVFDDLLYAEREAELIRLLVDLGATEIVITEKQEGQLGANANINAEVVGAGGIEAEAKGQMKQSNKFERKYVLEGNQWTKQMADSFEKKESNYSWLPYEPTWGAVAHARLHGKCLTASIELTNDSSYSIAGKIGLTEGLVKNIGSLSAGANFNQSQMKSSLIDIKFAPSSATNSSCRP